MNRRYIKKPLEIEAFRFGFDAKPDWFLEHKDNFHEAVVNETYLLINTLEGVMRANHGDYIIKGIKGEIYPCEKDVFNFTYEEVMCPYVVKVGAPFDTKVWAQPGSIIPARENE